jgi:hypothetical protein
VITGWQLWHPAGQSYAELVMIDVASGKRLVLLSAPEYSFSGPRVSPDGRFIACQRETQTTPERPLDLTLVLLGVNGKSEAGEAGRDLLPGLDVWPAEHRVPVSEALRLWWDLSRYGIEAKFLYFPDENHWILTPGNARIWYETVFAFLAQHVLGREWERPALL